LCRRNVRLVACAVQNSSAIVTQSNNSTLIRSTGGAITQLPLKVLPVTVAPPTPVVAPPTPVVLSLADRIVATGDQAWGPGQGAALLWIVQHESVVSPWAVNPSSVA